MGDLRFWLGGVGNPRRSITLMCEFYNCSMTKDQRPKASSVAAKHRMEAGKPKDTKPEIELRIALRSLGLEHFQTNQKVIKGSRRDVDIVFPTQKIAVFIDGCFWHGCPKHGTWPKANSEFWFAKIQRNKKRDKDTNKKLRAAGWKVVRIWEHENPIRAAKKIAKFLAVRDSTELFVSEE
jgi:DNA mismatch endonuclease, patch repair protein